MKKNNPPTQKKFRRRKHFYPKDEVREKFIDAREDAMKSEKKIALTRYEIWERILDQYPEMCWINIDGHSMWNKWTDGTMSVAIRGYINKAELIAMARALRIPIHEPKEESI
jgi:hypothetical protein